MIKHPIKADPGEPPYCGRVVRREFCNECAYPMSEAQWLEQTVPHGPEVGGGE